MSKLIVFFAIVGIASASLLVEAQDELQTKANADATKTKAPQPLVFLRQGTGKGGKPDFWLIWLLPYEGMIPKPLMDQINSQVRPQTEQISSQIINQVPGADQFWSQISGIQSSLSNAGGLQGLQGLLGGGSSGAASVSGSGRGGGLAGLIPGLGRR